MRALTLLLSFLAMSFPLGEARAQIIYGNPRAVDGDTLDFGGGRVRLFGIDAPEAAQTCQREAEDWACGAEAKALLESLIAGQRVNCEQRDIDRYGRPVATCSVGRLDLADAIARTGLAIALEQFGSDYVPATEQARNLRLGIWGGTFQTPAEFRASDPASRAEVAEIERNLARERRQEAVQSRPVSPARSSTYFRNCNDARAAGAAPLFRGQPGYRPEMDGDSDGIACEPYRGR